MTPTALSLTLGGVFFALYAGLFVKPAPVLKAFKAYPRSQVPAWILTAICVAWFGHNLTLVDVGRFNSLKQGLWVAVPAGVYLIIRYIPDLLAVRSLAVLWLLGAQPFIVHVRWKGTLASTTLVLLAYLLIVKAMVLVVYPHLWFRWITRMEAAPSLRKGAALGGMVVAVGLVTVGLLSG